MKPFFTAFLLLFLLFNGTTFLMAQPGTLSTSFGKKGILTDPNRMNFEKAITSQQDKKIIIGSSGFYQGYNTFMIDRLLPDGSKDSSFGIAGTTFILIADDGGKKYVTASITAIALLPDGKIVAAGYGAGSTATIALARFLPNGTPDSSFGSNGASLTSFNIDDIVNGLALQPDGKLVVTGESAIDFSADYRFFTARYLADGSVDESFGNGGIAVSNTSGSANAVAVQPDGKIVSAGYSIGSTGISFHTERYTANGTYDDSFGTNGLVNSQIDGGFLSFANDVALQHNGKIIVAGRSDGAGVQTLTVVRYNSDGSFDNSFGGDGVVTTQFSDKTGDAEKVILTGINEDRIVVTGSVFSSEEGGDFVVTSYKTDGSLDSAFGNAGIQTTDFGGTDFDNSATLLANGKIVVLGSNLGQYDYTVRALAVYNGYPLKTSLFVKIKKWLQNHTLSWNGLSSADDIAFYSVEQSKNGNAGFTEIGKVAGYGHSNNYSLTNSRLLPGINYYRVKAVSADGAIQYSEVVSADNTVSSASVYPNPANDFIIVKGLQAATASHISISNGNGNVMAQSVSKGVSQYRFQISHLQPGTYYINITATTRNTEIIKFMKE